jgi:hypothetical protein
MVTGAASALVAIKARGKANRPEMLFKYINRVSPLRMSFRTLNDTCNARFIPLQSKKSGAEAPLFNLLEN